MNIKVKGFKPFSYQKEVIKAAIEGNGKGRKIVVKSRRQCGKSLLLANLLLYFSLNFNGTQNYCVSPTLKQARKLYRQIVEGMGNQIIKSRNATELVIVFINGSQISFKSAEQREALRGESVSKNGILCIDECAYILDSVYYNLLSPWTDFHKAVTVMVSTPFIKQGFFFKMFNYGLNGDYDCVSIDWSDARFKEDMDKILSPEKLAEYKQVLPPNVFKSEYLGEWIDDDGLVFQITDDLVRDRQIMPSDRLYVGIDWSNQGENDDSSITIFNQNGEMVYVKYFNNSTPLRQIERFSSILEPYLNGQVEVIQVETNSIGTPYMDLLKEKSPMMAQKVVGFNNVVPSALLIKVNLTIACLFSNTASAVDVIFPPETEATVTLASA